VILESKNIKNIEENSILVDQLISSTITENLILANKISKKILLNDPDNLEANLINIVGNILNNNKNKLLSNKIFDNNELIDFIFFSDQKIKTKEQVSNSFVEIVRSSYSNSVNLEVINYNYLLFYISLAIIVNPLNDDALFIKAQLYQMLEKYFLAENSYKKIEKSSSYYSDAQRNIAFNYSKFLDNNEAEKKILEIIDQNEKKYLIKRILADFYRINGKYQKAIEVYNDLILEEEKDLWNLYYLRGICFERLDLWNKAEKDFLYSLKINPNSPNVLNYLAYGWLERNMNIDNSLNMLKKAYQKSPDNHYIIDSLAWAYFKKNNLVKAATLMEKVIDIAPGEAISLDHLADIYFAMNRKREAVHFWKQAQDLAEPEDNIYDKIEEKLRALNAG
tara:strand:+ start:45193 stop:46371 length:1179 start_codon:yes stop_codon:yes gene_type:complete